MASSEFKKDFSGGGENLLSGVAALTLRKVATERISEANSEASADAFSFFRSRVGSRAYDGPDRMMAALADAGISPETVLDTLIPDLATLIGAQWMSDDMTWSTVTVVSARLQTLAWRYIGPMMSEMSDGGDAPSVLMVVAEGETHTLGGVLAVGALIREGVNATGIFGEPDHQVFNIAREGAFDVIGVSTSGFGGQDRLAPLIEGLRDSSNDTVIAIGGSITTCNPQLALPLRGVSHNIKAKSPISLLQSGLTKGGQSAQIRQMASVSELSVA